MLFLPGEHTFKVQINITNVKNFSMINENGTSTVICKQSDCNGFHFENVQNLYINSLIFSSDGHSITATQVHNFVLKNCTLANNGAMALIAHESALFLEGNTFVNNSVLDKVPTIPYPGGAVSIFSSNMSLQGQNYFFNNTCFGGYCGGSAIFATSSLIIVEGNVSIVNNSVVNTLDTSVPSGGGGVLFYGSEVYVAGHMTFINNSVNTTYIKDNACEVAGGGALLAGGATIISGRITFVNNVANGETGCGGGLGLIRCTVTITGDIEFTHNQVGYYGAGIFANGNARIVLVGSLSFTENSANRGGGLAMLGGGIDINGSMSFINNYAGYDGGGMDIEEGYLSITGNLSLIGNSAAYGGGINILNTNVDVSSTGVMSLTDNHGFSDDCKQGGQGGGWNMQNSIVNTAGILLLHANTAHCSGGGIAIGGSSVFVSGNLTVTDNVANLTAGGILIAVSNVTLCNVFVSGNTAIAGGGLGVQSSNVNISEIVTIASNSAAYNGGGATMVISNLTINGTLEVIRNSAVMFGAGIVTEDCKIFITGHMLVAHNYANFVENGDGGGMVLCLNSIITVIGTLSLCNNSAAHSGGGMFIDETSTLRLSGKVYIVDNTAELGGAVYIADRTQLVYCSSEVGVGDGIKVTRNCFFQNLSIVVGHEDTVLVFDGNMAEFGAVLFGGLIDRCKLYNQVHKRIHNPGAVFDAITKYSDHEQTNSLISSNPYHMCLCENNKPQCGKGMSITAYPGETFHFQAVAVGQRNGTAKAVINAITKSLPSGNISLGAFEDRQVSSDCTQLNYTIFSDLPYVVLKMYVDGSCSALSGLENSLQVPVKLLPCPPGFTLSEEPYHCICEERLQKYTNVCDINSQTILRDGDFWIGYDNKSHELIVSSHCPVGYCTSMVINFTLNTIDYQCTNNRTGLLCGTCSPGLSLAIGSSNCLPCSDAYLSLIVLFAVMGLAFMALLLVSTGFTVRIGIINGIVFYASIVGVNEEIFFPTGRKNILGILLSWIRLDFGIETCFYDGMDMYAKTWLQFVFPIYIFGLILLFITFQKCCSSIIRRFYTTLDCDSKNYYQHMKAVLATFFIMSYAKITNTIIVVFSYTTVQYPNNKVEVVWLYDANIRYFHGKHIPLFAVSLLFSVIVVLPFTLLLLFGQCLERFPRYLSWITSPLLNSVSIFHEPYKRKHRYWPGLLLVVRFSLFVIFGINALRDYGENLLAISVATIGILVWPWIIDDRVYKRQFKWFGLLEASYMLNLGTFAFATSYIRQSGGHQAVLAYISTGIALTSFVVTSLYHVYKQRKRKLLNCLKSLCRKHLQLSEENEPAIKSSTISVSYKSGDNTEIRIYHDCSSSQNR